jgi:hypothetical protein
VKSEITARYEGQSLPFLLETEDGARRMLDGIRARKRVVHFPWQLSIPMIYGLHNVPGWLYDRAIRFYRKKKSPYVRPPSP